MPMRTKDMWFIFVPPGAQTSEGEPSPAGRWHIPLQDARTEEARITYAVSQGAKFIIRHDKIEWRAT